MRETGREGAGWKKQMRQEKQRPRGVPQVLSAQLYHPGDRLYSSKLSGLLGVRSARLENSWYLKRSFSFQNAAPSLDHGYWHRPFGPSRIHSDFLPMTLTLLCAGLSMSCSEKHRGCHPTSRSCDCLPGALDAWTRLGGRRAEAALSVRDMLIGVQNICSLVSGLPACAPHPPRPPLPQAFQKFICTRVQ